MSSHSTRTGIILGCSAILIWSSSPVGTRLAGETMGVWQFLAIAGLVSGAAQIVIYIFMRMPLGQLMLPPPKLWGVILLCFVPYMIIYAAAMVSADPSQIVGVSLANYLWPTLTIVCAVLLVPGTSMTRRLVLAMAMALAGLFVANLKGLGELTRAGTTLSYWPYIMGVLAAVSWAIYSALLARWRSWASRYATAPMAFLITGLVALVVCLIQGWVPMTPKMWAAVLFVGFGPQAGGYLLWELALHRAPASTLGLLASAIPVLSTIWLLVMLAVTGDGSAPNYVQFLVGAGMIGGAVLLGAAPRKPQGSRGENQKIQEIRAD